tara:strand:+ start:358 stop:561 length:204 start_codon:yes stop_codon:yes gene_type:complete
VDFILKHHFLDSHTDTIATFHDVIHAVKFLEKSVKDGKSANDEDAIELIATDYEGLTIRIHYHNFEA